MSDPTVYNLHRVTPRQAEFNPFFGRSGTSAGVAAVASAAPATTTTHAGSGTIRATATRRTTSRTTRHFKGKAGATGTGTGTGTDTKRVVPVFVRINLVGFFPVVCLPALRAKVLVWRRGVDPFEYDAIRSTTFATGYWPCGRLVHVCVRVRVRVRVRVWWAYLVLINGLINNEVCGE
jgi:hypothetical protein